MACFPFANLHFGLRSKGKSLTCLGIVFPMSFVVAAVVARIFAVSAGHHLTIKAAHVHTCGIFASATHQRVGIPTPRNFPPFAIVRRAHSLPLSLLPLSSIHHTVFQPQHAITMTAATKYRALVAKITFLLQHLCRSISVKCILLEVASAEKSHNQQCREPKKAFRMVYFSFHSILAMMLRGTIPTPLYIPTKRPHALNTGEPACPSAACIRR